MPWPRDAQRVLIVLAVALLGLGAVLGGNVVRRTAHVAVPDDPGLEVRLDLNRATPVDLETLPGVGKTLAGRIVAHRAESGPFCSVDELLRIPGFGEKLVAALRPLVTVGDVR